MASKTHNLLMILLHSLGAGLADVDDVGEEVVVLGLGHGLAELRRVLEHADEDLQAVQIRVFRRDHLKYGLEHEGRVQQNPNNEGT